MFANKLGTAALAVLVLVAAVGPAMAAGGDASNSVEVTVQVTQTETIVTVSEDGQAASGAQVDLAAVDGRNLAVDGSYTADADGQIHLPAPLHSTTVDLAVASGDAQATTTLDLEVPETGSWQQTVTLDSDASYEGSADAAVGSQQSIQTSASSVDDVRAALGLLGQSSALIGTIAQPSAAGSVGASSVAGVAGAADSVVASGAAGASGAADVAGATDAVGASGAADVAGATDVAGVAGSAGADAAAETSVDASSAAVPSGNSSSVGGESTGSVDGAVSSSVDGAAIVDSVIDLDQIGGGLGLTAAAV